MSCRLSLGAQWGLIGNKEVHTCLTSENNKVYTWIELTTNYYYPIWEFKAAVTEKLCPKDRSKQGHFWGLGLLVMMGNVEHLCYKDHIIWHLDTCMMTTHSQGDHYRFEFNFYATTTKIIFHFLALLTENFPAQFQHTIVTHHRVIPQTRGKKCEFSLILLLRKRAVYKMFVLVRFWYDINSSIALFPHAWPDV